MTKPLRDYVASGKPVPQDTVLVKGRPSDRACRASSPRCWVVAFCRAAAAGPPISRGKRRDELRGRGKRTELKSTRTMPSMTHPGVRRIGFLDMPILSQVGTIIIMMPHVIVRAHSHTAISITILSKSQSAKCERSDHREDYLHYLHDLQKLISEFRKQCNDDRMFAL